ncbi:MAG: complex I NDUFA9 subunit family protein [Candidatus Dormibacteria bacterium]
MRIAVVGGTGFVGSHVIPELLAHGHELRVVGRGARSTTLPPGLDPTQADVVSGRGLERALEGSEALVNLVAVIRERGLQTFQAVNADGTANVVRAATEVGVSRFVQFSAIGADPDPQFPYLCSKWQGEQAVMASSMSWVILRSSTIFGKGKGFFTQLAKAIALPAPFLIIPGDGTTVFQPIAGEDVARCVRMAVEEPQRARQTYEIGGPKHVSLEQITEEVARVTDKEWFGISKRKPLHLDPRMLRPGAVLMDKLLSDPLVTPQQLDMLGKANVTRVDAVRVDFGFEPRPMHGNLDYLVRPRRWPKLAA